MRVGVIFAAWQCADLLPSSLPPWVEAKRTSLGGHTFQICAVSVPFEGFPQDETRDTTRSILGAHAQCGEIDHVVVGDKPHKETDARGAALRWLMTQGVDVVWQVDSDERYTAADIMGALGFVQLNPFVTWFRLSLVNLVYTEHQRLAEPFTPPRIHRARVGAYRLHSFWDDNNLAYGGVLTRDLHRDVDREPSMTIPESIAAPLHFTWLNDLRSKKKQAYQRARWGHCAFCWDDTKGGLCFDETYYAKAGLSLPVVIDV